MAAVQLAFKPLPFTSCHRHSHPPLAHILHRTFRGNKSSYERAEHSSNYLSTRRSIINSKPQAKLRESETLTSVDEEHGDVERSFHTLPSGLRLEVLTQKVSSNAGKKEKPMLVFVHGSYHAAWCWSVHWMPYFMSLGYECCAVSLAGQGGSDPPSQSMPELTLESHARDIAHLIACICEQPPVLIGHSFGGLMVQYYVSQMDAVDVEKRGYPKLSGAILICSVPPTGNSPVVKRFLTSRPIASIKVTLSLAAKMFTTSLSMCRETFFSPSLPESEVVRYQSLMKGSSKVPLFNIRKLNEFLPIQPPGKGVSLPILVVGAENDFILDRQAIDETAVQLGAKEVILPGIAHDVMLDTNWKDAADVLDSWMSAHVSTIE